MKINNKLISLFIVLSTFTISAESDTQVSVDDASGVKTWETSANGAHFMMRQILPDQLMGFYLSRGFEKSQIKSYTESCVFMAVVRNDTVANGLHFKRENIRVTSNNQSHHLTSVDDWKKQLKEVDSKQSAMIAFRWAQFPIDQVFEPGGDWNQGMISVGLKPEQRFNINLSWNANNKIHEIQLEDVECAK